MKQWIKAAIITGPLLVLGTVYAFASSGSSGVTFAIHPSQPSSQSSGIRRQSGAAIQITTEKNVNSITDSNTSVQNPFLAASGQGSTASGQSSSNSDAAVQSNEDQPQLQQSQAVQAQLQEQNGNHWAKGKGHWKKQGKKAEHHPKYNDDPESGSDD